MTDTTTNTTITTTGSTIPQWLIPDRAYQILKWLALMVLPALAVFVSAVGPAWGWPHIQAIVTTLNALALLDGTVIGLSAVKAAYSLAA